jgi:hypothetical protein
MESATFFAGVFVVAALVIWLRRRTSAEAAGEDTGPAGVAGAVRWLGFAAALIAGVLGAVWLIEAAPPDLAEQQRRMVACLDRYPGNPLRYALCPPVRAEWNESLVLRGLLAWAFAVIAALMAVRVGERR